jgi:hypothetical protein
MPEPPLPPIGASEVAAVRHGRARARNRVLATLLAGVAALGFTTVISLAVLLHYAETHHLLANL